MEQNEILQLAHDGIMAKIHDLHDKALKIERELMAGSNPAPVPVKRAPRKRYAPAPPITKKRTLSPAARKRIADGQKRRWAEYHKAKAAA